jgi:hypothetical protein
MNDLSAFDILMYGALAGAVLVAVGAALWAMAYRGRQRWSTDRADQLVADGMHILTARPGDAVVITYPGLMTQEQQMQIIAAVERKLPKGVMAIVLENGLRMSHVVSVSDLP